METISIIVLLIFTFIATLVDVKKKEVPDFISYFLIIFGITINLIASILQLSVWPIVWSLVGAGIFYAFGAALYYTGVWGGGDAKLLTGFGAILANFQNVTAWPFLITIIFNILLFGALIGIFESIRLAIKNRKEFIVEARNILKKYKYILYLFWGSLIIVVYNLLTGSVIILIVLIWSFSVLFFYLLIALKSVENVCMYKQIKPSKLVEGDWVVDEITINNKLIYKPKAEGITKEYINILKEFEEKGKLKMVTIKDGIPYVPAFF